MTAVTATRPWAVTTLVGAGLAVVAAFLPWVEASIGIFSVERDGIDGDGQITLLVALLVAALALLELLGQVQHLAWAAGLQLAGGAGIGAVAGYHIADFSSTAGIEIGEGLYITALAAVIVLAGGVGSLVRSQP